MGFWTGSECISGGGWLSCLWQTIPQFGGRRLNRCWSRAERVDGRSGGRWAGLKTKPGASPHRGFKKKKKKAKETWNPSRSPRKAGQNNDAVSLPKYQNSPAISSVSAFVSLFENCQNNKLKEALVYEHIYLDWHVCMSPSETAFRKCKS